MKKFEVPTPGLSRLPKYRQVYELLLSRIGSGEYPPGTRLPPETELPAQLGASLQTTRLALQELVRSGLLIRRRGDGTYVADQRDPPLLEGRSLRLGVLLSTEANHQLHHYSFNGQVCRGILSEWGAAETAPTWHARGKAKTTRAEIRQPRRGLMVEILGEPTDSAERCPPIEDVEQGRFDGLISVGIIEIQWLENVLALGLPMVIVDFPSAPFHTQADLVFADAVGGYVTAVQDLVARGAKRIHFVGQRKWLPSKTGESIRRWRKTRSQTRLDPDGLLRLNAYRQGLDIAGIAVRDEWIHFAQANERGQEELLDRFFSFTADERPDALVCQDLHSANILIQKCGVRGLSVLGAGACSEPTSGPALPILLDGEEMGRVAAELLLGRLQRPKRPFLNVGVRMTFYNNGAD